MPSTSDPPADVSTVTSPAHGALGPAEKPPPQTQPEPPKPRSHAIRKWLLIHGIIAGLVIVGYFLYPRVVTMLNTVSTDDAYVNGHVTFVAPRCRAR